MRIRGLGCAMAMSLTTTGASALNGDWVVLDLGASRAESVCVEAASEAFRDFGNVFGIADLTRGNWTVYGYGLDNDQTDAVVTCTFASGNSARATLIIYTDNQVSAGIIAQRFEGYFLEHNARLGAEWLQRAFDRADM